MKRLGAILLAVLSIVVALPAAQPPVGPDIRLVLLIAVDQFRYDYLTRFRAEYSAGSSGCWTMAPSLPTRTSNTIRR